MVDLNNEVVLKKEKNPHWSAEETYFLARSEADAILKSVKAKDICGYLYKLHTNRSKEAVKKQRRKVAHRELVERLVGRDRAGGFSQIERPAATARRRDRPVGNTLFSITGDRIIGSEKQDLVTVDELPKELPDDSSGRHPSDHNQLKKSTNDLQDQRNVSFSRDATEDMTLFCGKQELEE